MLKGTGFLIKIYAKYQFSALVFIALYSLLSAVLPFAGIVFPKYILDELIGDQDVYRVGVYVGLLLLCTLFGNTLINYFQAKFFLKGILVLNAFTVELSETLYKADLQNIESPSFLDLQEKAKLFLYADGYGFGGVLYKAANVFAQAITLLGIISIISVLHPAIVLTFIGTILLSTYVNSKVKKSNVALELERPAQERRLAYDQSLFSEYKYAKEIRIYNLGQWLLSRLRQRMNTLYQFYYKIRYNILKMQVFSNIATFVQQILSYAYLVYRVIARGLGIGSFSMYLNAINSFSGAMTSLMDSIVDIRRFSDYYDEMAAYLNIPSTLREGTDPCEAVETPPVIEFRHVFFRYPGQKDDVLKDINLTINSGEKLSIVGENGAGKTTFIKLLLRLYKPSQGNILVNGIDIMTLDFDDYVALFSVVFQDFSLFSMSLRENISFGKRSTDDEIDAVLKQSMFRKPSIMDERNWEIPINKQFDENGFEPSGGEGQKIAMARALYKNAPIVILDEPTAALDPRTEYEIYRSFKDMVNNKTALFISHRLSSSKFCDKIAVFSNGEIVEYGTHEELITQKNIYYELFQMQAQFYVDEGAEYEKH